MFSKTDLDIDKFNFRGGGHLGFRDIEALVAIFFSLAYSRFRFSTPQSPPKCVSLPLYNWILYIMVAIGNNATDKIELGLPQITPCRLFVVSLLSFIVFHC